MKAVVMAGGTGARLRPLTVGRPKEQGDDSVSIGRNISSPLRILFLAAEAAPLIKVGGLADVAGSLPKSIRALGHDIRVALPLHPPLHDRVAGQEPVACFALNSASGSQEVKVFSLQWDGVPFYLVDGSLLRVSDVIYHAQVEQDAPKFVFFSLAALELTRRLDWKPHLVHANDWHTGAAIYWLHMKGRDDSFFVDVSSLITVHSLHYLGDGAEEALRLFGLSPMPKVDSPSLSLLPDWARDALLPLALTYADMIVAVSPTYAQEILTPDFSCGLESLLQARVDRLRGIINGLDTERWDPAHDTALEVRFDLNHLEKRARNKAALQRQFGFAPQTDTPLLGIVSRLDYQKGLDLALPALTRWIEEGGQVAVLGTGDQELERRYRELAERYPAQMAVVPGFHPELASRIYAGTDLFLMPSRSEPCGLSQLIAMRYGCVPVVRATGGLRDTVRDAALGRGTGFVFTEVTPGAIVEALSRARSLFAQPRRWRAIQRRAMRQDFSWRKSARAYVTAYQQAMALHDSQSPISQLIIGRPGLPHEEVL